jgi:hypothetical protein
MLAAAAAAAASFEVTLPAGAGPVTGRLLVVVAKKDTPEPRQAIGIYGAPVFGRDVEALQPGVAVVVDERSVGYPVDNLAALPPGDYVAQAVLITYEQVTRADGHTIRVPMSDRRTVNFAKPGNLYSKPKAVALDADATVGLELTEIIEPLEQPEDTVWIRDVTIHSEILSDFWQREVNVHASVLLPKGFAEHPDARYPVVFPFGHFGGPFSFNTDPETDTESARAAAADANVETGYQFYQEWSSDDFPRVVAVTFEHPTPFFLLESYAVDSANNGPWGRAFTEEVIPRLEKEFRLIGAPYARIVEGASTGGWEALALQLRYPDYFGGAWVFNPDPISFRHYLTANIYEDDNMFTLKLNDWMSVERPFRRTREGLPTLSFRQLARLEAVLGSRGRSGYQLDIWQATHGPVGDDGYPKLLFDKLTGEIDRDVAEYYRENGYDLTEYARDNWDTLGSKLRGKLNFFSGEMDEFYLNLGVYDFEAMIDEVAADDYPIRFEYGRPKKGHNWHHTDWAGVVREMADQVRRNAPPDADTDSWNY